MNVQAKFEHSLSKNVCGLTVVSIKSSFEGTINGSERFNYM